MPLGHHRAVYPLWQEAQHDLFSAAGRAGHGSCSDARSGDGRQSGCAVCDGGWVEVATVPQPDVLAIMVHYVLPISVAEGG